MDRSAIHGVIFDCDGTLVDSEKISLAVLIDCIAAEGLQISHADAMERFAGNELSVVFREFEAELGRNLPESFLDDFRERQMERLAHEVTPIAGVPELLGRMAVPFCVASNAPLNKVELCLRTTALLPHFPPSQIISAYEVGAWKPEPDVFLKAAEVLQLEARNCAVVEDSIFGVKAGLAAGMQVIALDPAGRIPPELNPVHRICHISELEQVLPVSPIDDERAAADFA